MLECKLKKPIEKHIQKGHPWIFRDALENPNIPVGTQVKILNKDGKFCCVGIADSSEIGVRIFSLKERSINKDFLSNRIYKSLQKRETLLSEKTNAIRLIHGEGDFLPGVVLDKYANYGVLFFDGEGILSFKESIVAILKEALKPFEIFNLLQLARKKHKKEIISIYGSIPREPIPILENGMKLYVDIVHGQKTGMFLDHRNTRKFVREISDGKNVLNLFSYTGGFSIASGLGKANHVKSVDISKNAISLLEKAWDANYLPRAKHTSVVCDVFEFLHQESQTYDLIVCDPPSFAPNEKAKPKALRAYTKLHFLCLSKLKKGGIYVAASCSSHINFELFQKTIFHGAQGQNLEFIKKMRAAEDHPIRNSFPEGDYLKVFVVRKI